MDHIGAIASARRDHQERCRGEEIRKVKLSEVIRPSGWRTRRVSPSDSLATIVGMLEHEPRGALLVSSDGEVLQGVLTEHDIVEAVSEFGAYAGLHVVADVMTRNEPVCEETETLERAIELMETQQVPVAVITVEGKPVDILDLRRAIRLRLSEVDREAKELRDFVTH